MKPASPDEPGSASRPLALGYSPCPNDTFIFTSWVQGLIPGAPPVRPRLEDIDLLNRLAQERQLDIIKVSFHAFAYMRDDFRLLHAGGALGRGCGPLVVAREPLASGDLADCRIAIPGERTTAALLLRLFCPAASDLLVMPFHAIMAATRDGAADAGLIIHESRFTYPQYGLRQVVDLGQWWEEETGHPIPLGGIVVRRSLARDRQAAADAAIAASLRHAWSHPAGVWDSVRRHAQEMADDVMRRHIDLYVNAYSLDYGPEGERAIRHLLDQAGSLGLVPRAGSPLFWDD